MFFCYFHKGVKKELLENSEEPNCEYEERKIKKSVLMKNEEWKFKKVEKRI